MAAGGAPRSCAVTWWGHATTTIEIGGVRILTDPVLTRRLGHLSRIGGPMPVVDARNANIVLISHMHSDHLHIPSLRQLTSTPQLVVPRGSGRLIRQIRDRFDLVHEVDVGDAITIGDVMIRAVPASHDGRRHPGSRIRGPALGYLIENGGIRVWFAGDTGLFGAMAELGPVDLALIPIGGWGPTLGEEHLDPIRAAQAARLAKVRYAVPIHYGTFWPIGLRRVHGSSFLKLFEQPASRFAAELAGDELTEARILRIGETARWAQL